MVDQTTNLTTAASTAHYYDRVWPVLGTTLHYTDRNRAEFLVECFRDLGPDSSRRILDLGCGRGWLAAVLSPFGKVTGVDFSPTGIEFAREHYGAYGIFHLADPASATLGLDPRVRFDVVVCTEVIEHAPDHSALLHQIAGFLEPRGVCLLTTPNGNIWESFRSDPRFIPGLQPVENWLPPDELRRKLEASGFRVVRHEGLPVYGFRIGLTGILQRQSIARLFSWLGLHRLYGRLIQPTAVYQVIVARKEDDTVRLSK